MGPDYTGGKSEKMLHFLIELLKHSNGGKVDWKEFIKDMEISTVKAAKSRFKRMMDPHGITERALTALTAKDGTPKKQAAPKKFDCGTDVIVDTDTESNKSLPTKKRKMMVVDPATVSEDDGGLEEAIERARARARARASVGGLFG